MIAALSLNTIPGMMLLHPVEWHLRDPKKVLKERQKLKGSVKDSPVQEPLLSLNSEDSNKKAEGKKIVIKRKSVASQEDSSLW